MKEGLPPELYTTLKEQMNVSGKALSKVLRLSERTIHRGKYEGRFKSDESERIMRLAKLLDLAARVFGDKEDAARWLKEKSLQFGLKTLLEYAETELGAREVEELLYRIEYNLLS